MILLAEDDDATRDAILLLLECESLPVKGFASCDALCAAADPMQAECLILDVHMQGMTGLELLEKVKQNGGGPPVVLMTGHLTPQIGARAKAAGAAAVLEKPFHGNELIEAVTQALR
jgi:FixJ family two-component response regulator